MKDAKHLSHELLVASQDLPGRAAHQQLSPVDITDYDLPEGGFRQASVMLLLYPYNDAWHTVYIQRTANDPRDKHAGQISLPGGKAESTDTSHAHTAVREVEEEIGVSQGEISVIAPLSTMYVSPSNFMVYPYIGIIDRTPVFELQVTEVDKIITPSIVYLKGMQIQHKSMAARDGLRRTVPYYDLHGHTLWGATSMITCEFLQMIEQIDF